MLSYFKQMMPFLKNIHDGKKFLIMNLIVNLGRREFTKMEVDMMKKIVFSMCGSTMFNVKSEVFVSKTKRFHKIYMYQEWVVVKKTFKDWKEFFASTPHEKG